MKRNILLFVFFLYCSNIGPIRALLPKVCLDESNCVLGKYMRGFETQLFEAFLGIPYAQPPIGDLRFSNPEEAKPWNGTLKAKVPKPDCVQKDYIQPASPSFGSEDCLYLNVYRPQNLNITEKLPVLFYIHEGGFFGGSSSPLMEGPEYFMDTKEVILVVPAYRLGLFGFLSTNDEQMTGNFGLKDQNLALKWVNTFISAFGGDPDRVTISGHSAGAASVHFHTLSPASKGLFQNAILMSGAANAFYAKPLEDPKAQVIKLAESAGIKGAANLSSTELVKALRKIRKIKLLKAADNLKSWDVYPLVTFRPNIEKSQWPNSFLTEDIFASLAANSSSISVPWIIGNVPSKGEGLVMALRLASSPILRANFNKEFDNLLRIILELPDTNKTSAVINCAVSKYMNGVHELNDETLDGFLELLGDASFIYPTYKTIQAHLNTNDEGASNLTGIIKFDYSGPYSYSEIYTGSSTNFSTVHYDDSLFLFKVPLVFRKGYLIASPEAALVRRYVGLYVEFAKTGKVKEFENIGTCTKNSFDEGECEYLSITKSSELFQTDNSWDTERMKLWNKAYN
ncbi:juvenile hormone esterase-like [Anastrepha obliqua]|uniref:juvenile hormone esterase-like n=1 Tax=Anastrepha obliqua TaxID=95512 RepID=UPI00240900A6|nr:juvenile hormone esterase-like [Anastrepha obliqua]